jgi:hypothetical protein
MTVTGTIRAELLKLFSVRTTYALIAASAAMGLLVVAGLPPPEDKTTGAALLLELFVAASVTYPHGRGAAGARRPRRHHRHARSPRSWRRWCSTSWSTRSSRLSSHAFGGIYRQRRRAFAQVEAGEVHISAPASTNHHQKGLGGWVDGLASPSPQGGWHLALAFGQRWRSIRANVRGRGHAAGDGRANRCGSGSQGTHEHVTAAANGERPQASAVRQIPRPPA